MLPLGRNSHTEVNFMTFYKEHIVMKHMATVIEI